MNEQNGFAHDEPIDASECYGAPDEMPKPDSEMSSLDRLSLKIIPGQAMGFLTIESFWEMNDETTIASISLNPDQIRAVAGRLIEIAGILKAGGFEKSEILLAEYKENC